MHKTGDYLCIVISCPQYMVHEEVVSPSHSPGNNAQVSDSQGNHVTSRQIFWMQHTHIPCNNNVRASVCITIKLDKCMGSNELDAQELLEEGFRQAKETIMNAYRNEPPISRGWAADTTVPTYYEGRDGGWDMVSNAFLKRNILTP